MGAGPGGARTVTTTALDGMHQGLFQAMGSPCEVLCETPDATLAEGVTAAVAAEAWRIQDKFSRYIDGNIIDRINTAGGERVELDTETSDLLDFAATLYDLSEGGFDITSGVLREAWTFDGSDRLPDPADVTRALGRVGWQKLRWERPWLQMPAGMEVDLGGIGKEYAVDRCAQLAGEKAGVPTLVNFGGDLAVTGPPRNRPAWRVGIEGDRPDAAERVIDLRSGALATSGDARRFLQKDGVRYSHILDPGTGWPVRDAPQSVTVAAPTCTEAGMLSTLAMLRGPAAEAFLDQQKVRYWCRRQTQ